MDTSSLYVIAAAGGNPTVIRILPRSESPNWYAEQGKILMNKFASLGVEQAGFLILSANRFEMCGGEFCGNAARAVAMLLSRLTGMGECVFQMSGYDGDIRSLVQWDDKTIADVVCSFDSLPIKVRSERCKGGELQIVDLGGIVHILIEGVLPTDYELRHRELVRSLSLTKREAVGVCWIERVNNQITLRPVVWVKAINSFFYETSCGSGSIAAAVVTGAKTITQPSGEDIRVIREGNRVLLQSRMEVIHEE